MMSTVMPFSASTKRTRWLCGHVAREYKVMTDLRLADVAMGTSSDRCGCTRDADDAAASRSALTAITDARSSKSHKKKNHKPQHTQQKQNKKPRASRIRSFADRIW